MVNAINAVQAIATSALPTCTYNNGSGGSGATLTASSNGAFPAVDGYTPAQDDNLAINGQVSALQNGLYTLTTVGDGSNPWVLTRRVGDDIGIWQTPFCVLGGNTYTDTVWCCAAPISNIGTSAVNFAQQALGQVTTFQYLTSGSSATYTTPANCRKIHIEMVGGGAGGGAATTNNGTAGNDTIFNSVHAKGGSAGTHGASGLGGAGGSGGTGSATFRQAGQAGTTGYTASGGNTGGSGGSSLMGFGAPANLTQNSAGANAAANSGAGGAGGWSTSTNFGGGGGGGEYVILDITSPAATYTYTVGAAANGGTAGAEAGGNGGSGFIKVTEYY